MYFNRWAKRDLTSACMQLATLCNIARVLEIMHLYWIRHKDFSQLDLKHNEICLVRLKAFVPGGACLAL